MGRLSLSLLDIVGNQRFCWISGKDGSKVTTVVATPGAGPDRPQEVSYSDSKVIGNGSFGVVYQAKLCETGELVAIKKVLQDKRFKVRKLLWGWLRSEKWWPWWCELPLVGHRELGRVVPKSLPMNSFSHRIESCKSCADWITAISSNLSISFTQVETR